MSESPKDAWVIELRYKKNDISHEHVKEEFKDIESHDRGGLNLIVIRDTQTSRQTNFMGIGEYLS